MSPDRQRNYLVLTIVFVHLSKKQIWILQAYI